MININYFDENKNSQIAANLLTSDDVLSIGSNITIDFSNVLDLTSYPSTSPLSIEAGKGVIGTCSTFNTSVYFAEEGFYRVDAYTLGTENLNFGSNEYPYTYDSSSYVHCNNSYVYPVIGISYVTLKHKVYFTCKSRSSSYDCAVYTNIVNLYFIISRLY